MPDLPDNATTTAKVSVGDYFWDRLEVASDRDWIALDAAAGDRVSINMMGYGAQALIDPYLRIYDANNVLVASNDDVILGDQQNAMVTFVVGSAGPYYIEAGAYADSGTGGYQIAIRDGNSPLNDNPLQALTWGTVQPDINVSVYFVPNGQSRNPGDGWITSEGFRPYERAQFLAAFAQIEAVSGLRFNITTDPNADFQIVLDTNEIGTGKNAYLGVFNPPGEATEGVGIFNGQMWDRQAGGDLERGGAGYVTLMHEILHGLGLSHPHDTGGASTIFTGVTSAFDDYGRGNLNQGIFTTMSYNSGYFTGTDGSAPYYGLTDYGYGAGPMALDIAVLQELYGAGAGYKGGNTTYFLPENNQPGTYWQAIWDTGGSDEIRYDGSGRANIDLRAATLENNFGGGGFVSAVRGIKGGYTIANGVVIENATGGSNADFIQGNAARNRLDGRAGFDTVSGDGGNDVVFGRDGNDKLSGNKGNDYIAGGRNADTIYGGDGNDKVHGERGDDKVYGQAGRDMVTGQDGQDMLFGNSGNDRIYGGNGNDQLWGGTDDDYLNGGAGNDRVFGEVGSDTLQGMDGKDYLNGGSGFDTIASGNGNDTVLGGTNGDTITAGNGNDRIWAGAGFDKVHAGAGDDWISGGYNGDVLTGGRGADTFYFKGIYDSLAGSTQRDTITDFGRDNEADVIDLRSIDGNRDTAGNQQLTFIGRTAFSGAAGELRYARDGANVIVQINNDSDGAPEMEILLRDVSTLSIDDFIL